LFLNRLAVNELDGFSTTGSSYFRFSQPVRNHAVMLDWNVRIVEMIMLRQSVGLYAPVAKSPLRGPNPILSPGVDYTVRLAPEADAGGTPATHSPTCPGIDATLNAALNGICRLTYAHQCRRTPRRSLPHDHGCEPVQFARPPGRPCLVPV